MKELDSQAQEVLDQYAKYQSPPVESMTPEQARNAPLLDYAARDLVASRIAARLMTVASPTPEQVGSIVHQSIAGPDAPILVRIYTPDGDGPFPVVVYFHGGGFVIATLDNYDASARAICNAAKCVVVAPAYRLAPEHKFPAAVDDAYATLRWTMMNAGRINGDATRVAVAGESAGGNLAAVVCQMSRDRGEKMPVHQVLIYPVVKWTSETPSYEENAYAKPLTSAMMPWFATHYLRSEADQSNPLAAPLLADDLSALPPATIITAENDPLRDDGRVYAQRLEEARVPVSYHHYDGVMHEFFGLAGLVPKAKEAVQQVARDLEAAFAEEHEGPISPAAVEENVIPIGMQPVV